MQSVHNVEANSTVLRVATSRLIKLGEDSVENVISTDADQLRTIKRIVRSTETVIPDYVTHLFSCLEKSSSERRKVILSLFDYFFNRSHAFRLHTVAQLEDVLRLCCETDPLRNPLPSSKEAARHLKSYSIKTIKQWHDRFGDGYLKLKGVSSFLQLSKSVDFERATSELMAEKKRKEELERTTEEKAAKVASSIAVKFENAKGDMERCLKEVDSALRILVPVFSEHDDVTDSHQNPKNVDEASSTQEHRMSLHGYSSQQTISVVLQSAVPVVTVSEENEDLVQTARDARVMLDVYRNNVIKWLRKLAECGAKQDIVRQLVDMKYRLDGCCQKIDELKLKNEKRKRKNQPGSAESESDSEESDLEDVPVKELEDFVAPYEVPSYIMDKIARDRDETDQPCCSKTLSNEPLPASSPPPVTSSSEEDSSASLASPPSSASLGPPHPPTLSFGLDLMYWGEGKRDNVQVPKNNSDCHRFWRPPDDEGATVTHAHDSIYSSRVFTFIGEERKTTRECRTRLNTGKLCPRRDVNRCPIHGLIVDRDEEGFPVEEQPAGPNMEGQTGGGMREEREYMRDLEAATGRSFSSPSKKKKEKKNSSGEGRAVRERLEKKLLDKRTVKRVSEVLDEVRKKKIERKFGHQFAHSLSR